MTSQATICVTLATYKAIEAHRLGFDETHDAIIRRALIERAGKARQVGNRALLATRGASRRRGKVRVVVDGQERSAFNLRDAYLVILTALTRHKSTLLHQLAVEGTDRRRWVAPSPQALFVTAPHLATEHAYRIAPEWFVDTNVSRAQIIARLTVACHLAGKVFGRDVMLIEG